MARYRSADDMSAQRPLRDSCCVFFHDCISRHYDERSRRFCGTQKKRPRPRHGLCDLYAGNSGGWGVPARGSWDQRLHRPTGPRPISMDPSFAALTIGRLQVVKIGDPNPTKKVGTTSDKPLASPTKPYVRVPRCRVKRKRDSSREMTTGQR